jgi:hypothetical protein
MAATLERRLEALEVATAPDRFTTIFVIIVTPGEAPDPVRITKVGTDAEWRREPGETRQDFEKRVISAQGSEVTTLLAHSDHGGQR